MANLVSNTYLTTIYLQYQTLRLRKLGNFLAAATSQTLNFCMFAEVI